MSNLVTNIASCVFCWIAFTLIVSFDIARDPLQDRREKEHQLSKVKSHKENENRNHERAERRYWAASALFGGLGTLGAVVAVGGAIYADIISTRALDASRQQAASAQAQLDEVRSENRPWLTLDDSDPPTPFSPFTSNQYGIGVSYSIGIKNKGKSPAYDFFVVGKITSLADTIDTKNDIPGTLKSWCDKVAPVSSGVFSDGILFPDDSAKFPTFFAMDAATIATSKGPQKNVIWPILLGCIVYKLSPDGAFHQSGFALDVSVRDVTSPTERYIGIDPTIFGDIPEANLRTVPSFFARGFMD